MFEVYNIEQSEKWDSIVTSFKDYDIYWMSGYVKAFYNHGDGIPLLFYYDDINTRGINVVMKRDVEQADFFRNKIEKNTFFDFATPYGYGGWIIEGNDYERLFDAYFDWIKNNNIICEFVRFHPMIKNHIKCEDFYNVIELGEVVHMDLSSKDLIWNNITSKNRNMIRKAQKNNIKIYNGRFPELFSKFEQIYNETMTRDNADSYYFFDADFYKSILDDLPYNSQIFYAEKDGIIIAASIILSTNKKMNYHLSGSLKEFNSLAPSNLLLYSAALWGAANGYESFYLGGGVGSGEDSLFKFKRSFYKGLINHFYIGKRIYNNNVYDMLNNMRKIETTNYFPVYRSK